MLWFLITVSILYQFLSIFGFNAVKKKIRKSCLMTEMTQMTRTVENPNNFIHKGITEGDPQPMERERHCRDKLSPTLFESIASINVSTSLEFIKDIKRHYIIFSWIITYIDQWIQCFMDHMLGYGMAAQLSSIHHWFVFGETNRLSVLYNTTWKVRDVRQKI